jgi:hypothetical protein
MLQLHPGVGMQKMTVVLWVDPQYCNFPPIRLAQAFQALDRGGLARAVRTNHAEDLTFQHLKTDFIYGYGFSVSLE